MATRMDLHNKLVDALGSDHVYYQPPESVRMIYPCIVYAVGSERVHYAEDKLYKGMLRYSVTLIDRNPEPETLNKIRAIRYCSFDRSYVSENLNHFVFNIYN